MCALNSIMYIWLYIYIYIYTVYEHRCEYRCEYGYIYHIKHIIMLNIDIDLPSGYLHRHSHGKSSHF